MLVPLVGIEFLAKQLLTIPRLLEKDSFFASNGYTDDEMHDIVQLYNNAIDNISISNRFQCIVERVKPLPMGVWDNIPVGGFISMFATSANVNQTYLGVDEKEVGATKVRHFSKQESGDVEISFLNPARNLVTEYFLKEGGEYIAPKDGTVLLPFDYYFKIEIFKWVIDEGLRTKSHYVDGFYHLASNPSFEFDTGSEEFQTFSLTFEKMKTGGIAP